VAARRPRFVEIAFRFAAAQSDHRQNTGGGGGASSAAAYDFYELLGVDPGCTQSDIKKAYRKIVASCHPDKANKAASAQRASSLWFRTVQQAYDVLGNPAKRATYDSKKKRG
jgi:preprotein translocase subunit Sec63